MEHTLVIGLGNPDAALEQTYHNVGALAVAWCAARRAGNGSDNGETPSFHPYKSLFSAYASGPVVWVRPLVYMNESGRAVKEAMKVFKADARHIVIVYDDSDLAIGRWKRTERGRSAGHKGIQSIIDHLGTDEFARIKIGIRDTDEPSRRKAGDFVLSPIRARDRKVLEEIFLEIAGQIDQKGVEESETVSENR